MSNHRNCCSRVCHWWNRELILCLNLPLAPANKGKNAHPLSRECRQSTAISQGPARPSGEYGLARYRWRKFSSDLRSYLDYYPTFPGLFCLFHQRALFVCFIFDKRLVIKLLKCVSFVIDPRHYHRGIRQPGNEISQGCPPFVVPDEDSWIPQC